MFYPKSPAKLIKQLQFLLESTKPDERFSEIVGIVSPHAGYQYSGKTAAYAYNTLREKEYKTVFILSPSHHEYFPGISIYEGDAYSTPLGTVSLNKEVISVLTDNNSIIFEGMAGHRNEHSVEVQIPFLQMILENFSIVPLVLGDQKKLYVDELARKLADVFDENSLIVASSDLSHFYTKAEAHKLDSIVSERIAKFDFEGLQHDLENDVCEACGGGAIVALMETANLLNKKNSKILSRSDSGDVSGDNSEVVGYLSAVVYE
jgi:AmmeMemoRadiSam system protein B